MAARTGETTSDKVGKIASGGHIGQFGTPRHSNLIVAMSVPKPKDAVYHHACGTAGLPGEKNFAFSPSTIDQIAIDQIAA